MRRVLLIVMLSTFFIGCASKKPITWENRVLKSKIKPLDLAYVEYGLNHKKTLILIHGFGESKYTWRFVAKDLAKKYRVIAVDLKGFGESPKLKDGNYSVYDQAKVLEKFIEQKKLKEVTLIGRSFGGGVALVLALMQEFKLLKFKIDKLILIDTMCYKQDLPSMMRFLQKPIIGYLGIHLLSAKTIAKEAYRYAFSNDDIIPQSSIKKSAEFLDMPLAKYAYKETVDSIIPDDVDFMEKLYKKISIPTLIIWGKDDISIPHSFGIRLHHDIKNSKLVIIPNVGHMPQEEAPKILFHIIDDFLSQTSN
jgi:pimeloyl-ACP methyl ester carboxylesterase